ncbi:hypothetical protein Gorai_013491 [Gossypium raimondii]|uniref:RNase H type-1 domain-containing protein n=1 Tax=Gossypium raimondii TaxID=29730 RepID=A0A7J8Q553_GOSRA|nr:hypothetical protein [Gossypium raimondii]
MEKLEDITVPMQNPRVSKWEPPEGGSVKANFDASFHQQSNKSVSVILIRNREGLVMVACTYLNEHVLKSTMAKARACLKPVIFTNELGFRRILVAGDTLTVFKRVRTTEEDKSNISNPVNEVKEMICRRGSKESRRTSKSRLTWTTRRGMKNKATKTEGTMTIWTSMNSDVMEGSSRKWKHS